MDIDLTLEAFKDNKIANPVIICRDGEEALAYISAHPDQDDLQLPSLVILDLHLPKVNGIEFIRRARQDPVWKKIPIVVLSISKIPSDISAVYELGANSYIVKPIDLLAFNEVVKQINIYWLLINEPPFEGPSRRNI
jgi:CheY-like chemotaxis protein